jgi:hypothetical protein
MTQSAFAFLAEQPQIEWVRFDDARLRLGVSGDELEHAIRDGGLEVRWGGGFLRPNGKRAHRFRLVELGALRAALQERR